MFAMARMAIQVYRNLTGFLETIVEGVPLGGLSNHTEGLKGVGNTLSELAKVQELHSNESKNATALSEAKAEELRRAYVIPIAKLEQVLVPQEELRAKIRAADMRSYEGVIIVAEGLAARVEPYKAKFVAAGFDDTFLDQLRAAVAAVRAARAAKAFHLGEQVRATAALKKEYARGRELVRLVDSMVTPHWKKTSPAKLAQWKSLSRFAGTRKSAATTGQQPPAVPVDTPVVPGVTGGASSDTRMA
jgi:hypothetical protein